jgi:hypothetical protein
MKTIAHIILCMVFAVLLAGMAAGCDIVTGSGETSTFEMDYKAFTRVEISTGFDVAITQAETFSVSITVDKSLYEYLSIAQRGDTLHIGLKSNYTYTAAARQAVIKLPDLRRLELSGGSKAVVTGFAVTHTMDFKLSGASNIVLNQAQAGDAGFVLSGGSTASGSLEMQNGSFELSGASTMEFTGSANEIKVNAAGASTVTLEGFPVVTAGIELSGASRAVINVSDLMDVNLSGASNLEYIGSPKLGKMDMSGGSTLNQK